MLYIGVSAFTTNSAAFVYNSAGALSLYITDDMVSFILLIPLMDVLSSGHMCHIHHHWSFPQGGGTFEQSRCIFPLQGPGSKLGLRTLFYPLRGPEHF